MFELGTFSLASRKLASKTGTFSPAFSEVVGEMGNLLELVIK